MTEGKHTQEQWTVHPASENRWGMTHEVIHTADDGGPESAGMFPDEESAILFAAAPDLADALDKIAELAGEAKDVNELPIIEEVARAALRKAGRR